MPFKRVSPRTKYSDGNRTNYHSFYASQHQPNLHPTCQRVMQLRLPNYPPPPGPPQSPSSVTTFQYLSSRSCALRPRPHARRPWQRQQRPSRLQSTLHPRRTHKTEGHLLPTSGGNIDDVTKGVTTSELLALVKDDLGYARLETSLVGEGLLSSSPLWCYCGFLHMSRGASSCRTPFDQFDISKNQPV